MDRGFVIFLLSVSVVQGQNDWGVTYASTQICALKGSTVDINCTYTYPSRENDNDTTADETFWFIKEDKGVYVDLRADSEYAGRVQHRCDKNDCTLRITDLRESDSAEYKFMFTTNQTGGRRTASPGVTLTVTDLQVRVKSYTYTMAEVECHSRCRLPDRSSYIWYEDGQETQRASSSSYSLRFYTANSYSCAVEGLEDFASLSAYRPKLPSLSVSPSGEIVEGSSVTLTCESDANPAANYTWSKLLHRLPESINGKLVISSIQSSDSGGYSCWVTNGLGNTIKQISVDVKLVQGQNDWGVTYASTQICALKGSTVDINSTYTYPSRENDNDTTADETFWFTKEDKGVYVDLRADSEYAGRVQHRCDKNDCTLRITDLRESDSAEYKFMFTTNQTGWRRTTSPGVTLTVTDLQVQVITSSACKAHTCVRTELRCHSRCRLDDRPSYIWYKNGRIIKEQTSPLYLGFFYPADSYSCALKGHETFSSPSLYAREIPSVSVSPSGEIAEHCSVTLTCSCDANPAANYTWYKKNDDPDLQPLSTEPQLVFSSIQSSDSGEYYCTAENELGNNISDYVFIDVKYAPKLPSVTVSPSGEIVEDSSVTLTCSSDANPAATYTWYKENADQDVRPLSKEPQLVFGSIQSSDSGEYYCTAENELGKRSEHIVTDVKRKSVFLMNIIRLILVVLMLIPLLLFSLWMRKKKTLSSTSELNDPAETVELDSSPVHENASAAQTEDTEEQEDLQ